MKNNTRWLRRDKKRHKARYGMRVDNSSLKTIQISLAHKRQNRAKKGQSR